MSCCPNHRLHFKHLLQMTQQVPVMEFGRRVAVERDLEKSEQTTLCNMVWDESGNFLMYGTLLGVKGASGS